MTLFREWEHHVHFHTIIPDETVFKEPPQPARVVKDSSTDVLYDNGFKQHIPVESLIFRYVFAHCLKVRFILWIENSELCIKKNQVISYSIICAGTPLFKHLNNKRLHRIRETRKWLANLSRQELLLKVFHLLEASR